MAHLQSGEIQGTVEEIIGNLRVACIGLFREALIDALSLTRERVRVWVCYKLAVVQTPAPSFRDANEN